MEHRRYMRLGLSLMTELYHRHKPLGQFRTRNISPDGMFVEAGAGGLCRHDLVDLDVLLFDERYTMRGLVVHRSAVGVGLVLWGMSPLLREAIIGVAKPGNAGTRTLVGGTLGSGPGASRTTSPSSPATPEPSPG